ncbi:MAG: hypothetical protein QG670_1451 [Thermoproteota archaeon]|nr:hypothetical protein [Thermoproteota archaeon]
MDFFDERVLAALRDGKSRSFIALLSEVGFSHNTLQEHLGRLVAKGIILREKAAQKGSGRPRFAYRLQAKTAAKTVAAMEDPTTELVVVPFSCLRRVCKFQSGRYCKETGRACAPQICPQTRKQEL